ncbi:protein FAM133-like [Ostrea edulis]|uniref:protein FAM133-like n=1 Tax=Ostrea edulis TaxID=37623 RepID=UPI0024AEE4EB|nr:protein FAM133-like [Ostrea edulis]
MNFIQQYVVSSRLQVGVCNFTGSSALEINNPEMSDTAGLKHPRARRPKIIEAAAGSREQLDNMSNSSREEQPKRRRQLLPSMSSTQCVTRGVNESPNVDDRCRSQKRDRKRKKRRTRSLSTSGTSSSSSDSESGLESSDSSESDYEDHGEVVGELPSTASLSSSSSDENEDADIDEQKEKHNSEKDDNLLERRLFRKKTK